MRPFARWPGTPLVALSLVAALPGCGHRGDPLPPLRHTPPGLAEFRFAQRGNALEVSLLAPAASVDGIAYERVVVEIQYAEGENDLDKAGSRREVLAFARQRVVETLPLPAPGTIARAAARGLVGREKGQRTLTMALVAQPEVAAPSELRARLAAGGVRLDWSGDEPVPVDAAVKPPVRPGMPPVPGAPGAPHPGPPGSPPAAGAAPEPRTPEAEAPKPEAEPRSPEAQPAGAKATPQASAGTAESAGPGTKPKVVELRKAGFFLYRRLGTESYRLPLSQQPLAERHTTDATAPESATACYVVRAAASVDPLVESAASNEVCVEVRDIEPPASPGGLAVLPREGGLEVVWTPSPESDVAGYRVYREGPAEPLRKVADVEAGRSAWLDTSARAGVVYLYTVTALDRAGNESPEAPKAEGSLP
ncbi:MAG TPA: fibronectin type III domain-containing protein [Vicinamibacteria bacterium]|jgi:hypothetical protein